MGSKQTDSLGGEEWVMKNEMNSSHWNVSLNSSPDPARNFVIAALFEELGKHVREGRCDASRAMACVEEALVLPSVSSVAVSVELILAAVEDGTLQVSDAYTVMMKSIASVADETIQRVIVEGVMRLYNAHPMPNDEERQMDSHALVKIWVLLPSSGDDILSGIARGFLQCKESQQLREGYLLRVKPFLCFTMMHLASAAEHAAFCDNARSMLVRIACTQEEWMPLLLPCLIECIYYIDISHCCGRSSAEGMLLDVLDIFSMPGVDICTQLLFDQDLTVPLFPDDVVIRGMDDLNAGDTHVQSYIDAVFDCIKRTRDGKGGIDTLSKLLLFFLPTYAYMMRDYCEQLLLYAVNDMEMSEGEMCLNLLLHIFNSSSFLDSVDLIERLYFVSIIQVTCLKIQFYTLNKEIKSLASLLLAVKAGPRGHRLESAQCPLLHQCIQGSWGDVESLAAWIYCMKGKLSRLEIKQRTMSYPHMIGVLSLLYHDCFWLRFEVLNLIPLLGGIDQFSFLAIPVLLHALSQANHTSTCSCFAFVLGWCIFSP